MTRYGAVEAGGTKFRAAIVDTDFAIVDEIRVPTTTPEETLGTIADYLNANPADALGVASFGPLVVDRSDATYGTMGTTPKPGWSHAPILAPLRAAVDGPADILTDVEAAAIAEHELGAGRGHHTIGYVTVGTGIGAAVAIDGVPVRGRDHTELGHIPVKRAAGDTFAGRCPFHGDCLEGMACGPAIAERWDADPASLADRDDVWDLEAGYLGQLVRVLAYAFAPDIVLFGGGIGTRPDMAERIQRAVTGELAGYSVSHADNDHLVATAGLGEDAGLIGAAVLAASLLNR